jgi:N-acetylneuraminate synthase
MNFNKKIKIGNFLLSEDSATFIIAEAGVNHGGDINLAKKLVDIGVEAGVNAVKFQAFKADKLILSSVKKATYQRQTTSTKESQYNMLRKLEISKEINKELKDYCEKKGIIFLTTPFEEDSLDELDALDLPAYKISSTDLTNLPFLEKVAKKGKPIILSTGMSYLAEVEMALSKISEYCKDVILLQCTANYPVNDDEVNLLIINTFHKHFDILVGFSDHTTGLGAAPCAVAMGAKVIEKHFTIDKNLEGPDHKASLNPSELIRLVREIRKVECYLGISIKIPTISELETRMSLQKCIVAATRIKKGDMFTPDKIIAKRTGGRGISPLYYEQILGRTAKRGFEKNEIIEL